MNHIIKPNLFIVGAAKAGTTSLYNYLKQHPDVFVSPIKEPNFFGSDVNWGGFREDHKKNTKIDFDNYFSQKVLQEKHIAFFDTEENYLKLFKESKGYKIRSEFSTSYLYSENAAREIYSFNKKAKIIIILREPVSRTFSHYLMDLSANGQSKNDILFNLKEDYNNPQKGYCISNLYLELSLYTEQVKRYLKIFPKNQILILRFEDLSENPQRFTNNIFDFIGIDPDNNIDYTSKFNQTTQPKNQLIKKIVRFKNYIPGFILKLIKKNKSVFYKPSDKTFISDEAKGFVENIVNEDWVNCQQLLKKEFNENN